MSLKMKKDSEKKKNPTKKETAVHHGNSPQVGGPSPKKTFASHKHRGKQRRERCKNVEIGGGGGGLGGGSGVQGESEGIVTTRTSPANSSKLRRKTA